MASADALDQATRQVVDELVRTRETILLGRSLRTSRLVGLSGESSTASFAPVNMKSLSEQMPASVTS